MTKLPGVLSNLLLMINLGFCELDSLTFLCFFKKVLDKSKKLWYKNIYSVEECRILIRRCVKPAVPNWQTRRLRVMLRQWNLIFDMKSNIKQQPFDLKRLFPLLKKSDLPDPSYNVFEFDILMDIAVYIHIRDLQRRAVGI